MRCRFANGPLCLIRRLPASRSKKSSTTRPYVRPDAFWPQHATRKPGGRAVRMDVRGVLQHPRTRTKRVHQSIYSGLKQMGCLSRQLCRYSSRSIGDAMGVDHRTASLKALSAPVGECFHTCSGSSQLQVRPIGADPVERFLVATLVQDRAANCVPVVRGGELEPPTCSTVRNRSPRSNGFPRNTTPGSSE